MFPKGLDSSRHVKIVRKMTNFLSLQDMFRQNLSSSVEWLQSKLNYKFWIQVADLKQLPGLKGEGHSKNREFFSITNKNFTLSWVTHRCFSFWSGCDPSEKEVENLTLGAAILKGSWRPGCISVTSFHPRVCLFFWALVWLLLKPEHASHSGGGNNQDELNDRLENAVWCTCERCTTIPKQRECVCCWEQLE